MPSLIKLITFQHVDWQVSFHPPGKLTAAEHHPMRTCFALQADIRTQAHDLPGVPAARVWFTQFYPIANLQIWQHAGIITHVIMLNSSQIHVI